MIIWAWAHLKSWRSSQSLVLPCGTHSHAAAADAGRYRSVEVTTTVQASLHCWRHFLEWRPNFGNAKSKIIWEQSPVWKVQLVKCLLQSMKAWVGPQHLCKSQAWWYELVSPELGIGRSRDRQVPGAHWPASLAKWNCPKKQGGAGRGGARL